MKSKYYRVLTGNLTTFEILNLQRLHIDSANKTSSATYFKAEFGIWLVNMYPRVQYSTFKMSKCDSISREKITSIGNLDIIHICAIQACV